MTPQIIQNINPDLTVLNFIEHIIGQGLHQCYVPNSHVYEKNIIQLSWIS